MFTLKVTLTTYLFYNSANCTKTNSFIGIVSQVYRGDNYNESFGML